MLRDDWLEKFKIPVETNTPAPVFLYLIAMYNDIKNMKQMQCSGKKKRKIILISMPFILHR